MGLRSYPAANRELQSAALVGCHGIRQSINEQLVIILRTNHGICAKNFEELAAARGISRNRARNFLRDA